MKLLIIDKLSKLTINKLKTKYKIIFDPTLKDNKLNNVIKNDKPDVLVVRSKNVFDYHLNNNENLKLVIRAGSGYDNIDCKSATENNIIIANCPGKNSIAVSELVSSFILTSSRKIITNDNLLKFGYWNKADLKTKGLFGSTLGIIGYGNIGKNIIERMYPFGINILIKSLENDSNIFYHSHSQFSDFKIPYNKVDLDTLLYKSDFVSLNIPSNNETQGLVNKSFLKKLKQGSTLINTSRNDIVIEEDILEHIEKDKEFIYCSDVFKNEPLTGKSDFVNKLAQNKQVIGTHHIGASTIQSENSVGEKVIELIDEFEKTNNIINKIN